MSRETSWPLNRIDPEVTGESRRIIFPIVDFPLPLSPISDTTSPEWRSKLTSRTAVSRPDPKDPTL